MPIVINTGTVEPTVPPRGPGGEPAIAKDLLSMTWTGWNGQSWLVQGDLRSKAIMELQGRIGFGMPPIEQRFTESATLDGATWQNYRVPPRPFVFPVFITGSTPTEAREEQARFMSTLLPHKQGVLTVADPLARKRYIDLRYIAGADEEMQFSTYGLYWFSHKLQMLAEWPYYYGDTVPLEFEPESGVNYYGGGDLTLAPPYYIANSQTTAAASITNPGDVDTWPVWTIHGPFTSFTGVIDGKTIELPIAKTLGHWIRVDSNPKRQTITDDLGANLWGSAGDVEFGRVPASATTELTLEVADTDVGSKVEVEFTPYFWRAW